MKKYFISGFFNTRPFSHIEELDHFPDNDHDLTALELKILKRATDSDFAVITYFKEL